MSSNARRIIGHHRNLTFGWFERVSIVTLFLEMHEIVERDTQPMLATKHIRKLKPDYDFMTHKRTHIPNNRFMCYLVCLLHFMIYNYTYCYFHLFLSFVCEGFSFSFVSFVHLYMSRPKHPKIIFIQINFETKSRTRRTTTTKNPNQLFHSTVYRSALVLSQWFQASLVYRWARILRKSLKNGRSAPIQSFVHADW